MFRFFVALLSIIVFARFVSADEPIRERKSQKGTFYVSR
jgi:hypothetical protein